MQHLALASGEPALAVAVHQRLDHACDLQQVAALDALHILAVAVVPVRRHVHAQLRELREHALDRLC